MATYTVPQDEDTTITLTANATPVVGSELVWSLLERATKDVLTAKSQYVPSTPTTTITITLTSNNTATLKGAYYYELWEHKATGVSQRLLDSGIVMVTATYAGDFS